MSWFDRVKAWFTQQDQRAQETAQEVQEHLNRALQNIPAQRQQPHIANKNEERVIFQKRKLFSQNQVPTIDKAQTEKELAQALLGYFKQDRNNYWQLVSDAPEYLKAMLGKMDSRHGIKSLSMTMDSQTDQLRSCLLHYAGQIRLDEELHRVKIVGNMLKEQVELNKQNSQVKDPISREREASDELTRTVYQSLALENGMER